LIYKTNRRFWTFYRNLPQEIQKRADEKFELLKQDSKHPSLRLKKVGPNWVVRINKDYRALATEQDGIFVWYWIGKHDEYMRRIREN
jgi:hypothetical protein